ncbi:YfiR family protein [Roseateles oligotrophus]|uniref:YfiR family protein n=1 Tax=Roseateles oligotrophus TaxID=1769250 RepID=A0ABT2Y8A5_9BURK|nr:YfiR family protein [Roseateles oligotrophus]MCV2366528.1 YfiR family protein [Roseateles oligotrophus]
MVIRGGVTSRLCLHFIKFIEWPTVESSGSFRLCVLGAKDEMREALSPLHGKMVGKSTIELVHVGQEAATNKFRACQILYQVGKLTIDLPQPLPLGLVLVVNGENSVTPNASIALMHSDDGRLEFSINQAAVLASGVKMSSQLLKLAVNRPSGGAK